MDSSRSELYCVLQVMTHPRDSNEPRTPRKTTGDFLQELVDLGKMSFEKQCAILEAINAHREEQATVSAKVEELIWHTVEVKSSLDSVVSAKSPPEPVNNLQQNVKMVCHKLSHFYSDILNLFLLKHFHDLTSIPA